MLTDTLTSAYRQGTVDCTAAKYEEKEAQATLPSAVAHTQEQRALTDRMASVYCQAAADWDVSRQNVERQVTLPSALLWTASPVPTPEE